jgi:hypothetical protein
MDVSDNSEAEGDPHIFNDDDEEAERTGVTEQTGTTGFSQARTTIPTITGLPKPVPPANNSRVSKGDMIMVSSKGKDREIGTKGKERKRATTSRATTSKEKGAEKDEKDREEYVDPKKIMGDKVDGQGKDDDGEMVIRVKN